MVIAPDLASGTGLVLEPYFVSKIGFTPEELPYLAESGLPLLTMFLGVGLFLIGGY